MKNGRPMAQVDDTRVMYYGDTSAGSTSRHRRDALVEVCGSVHTVDATVVQRGRVGRVPAAVARRLGFRPGYRRDNVQLVEDAEAFRPDVLWLAKPVGISATTVKELRAMFPLLRTVIYSGDDYSNRDNASKRLRQTIPEVDLVVTTKSYNVPELRAMHARSVHLAASTYEPAIHYPRYRVDDGRRDLQVVFVGHYEAERAESIRQLARAGVRIHVWGPGNWSRLADEVDLVSFEGAFLADDEYAEVLSRSRIALGFLRKANRDLRTTRSVEIPACGALLVAERTEEHEAMFTENREALFFSDDSELVEKVRWAIQHDVERRTLAAAGMQRVVRGPYTNRAMIELVLKELLAMMPE